MLCYRFRFGSLAGALALMVLVGCVGSHPPLPEPAADVEPIGMSSSTAPLFPWPPPRASATAEIPRNLLEARQGPTRLRDVDRRIARALDQNGYFDSSYYAVPAGFALVTKMEQIEPDGRSKPENVRWKQHLLHPGKFSLASYLSNLIGSSPGYYRVIVFVVTPSAFTQEPVGITQKEANDWIWKGAVHLPESIGDLDFSSQKYACTALIYEFERANEHEGPRIKFEDVIPGRTHLDKAGIWKGFQP